MKFSEEIITILDYLCQKFGVVVDWTSENVMPYLQDLAARYIKYEMFSSIAWMVIIPIITLLIAIPLTIFHKKAKELKWNSNYHFGICSAAICFWIVFSVMAFASICVICTQVFDIIECCALPEKVIFEYLKTLMNSTSR